MMLYCCGIWVLDNWIKDNIYPDTGYSVFAHVKAQLKPRSHDQIYTCVNYFAYM